MEKGLDTVIRCAAATGADRVERPPQPVRSEGQGPRRFLNAGSCIGFSPHVGCGSMIGIGGSLAAPPLPHHRTYGSVYGGSRGYANALRSNDSTRVGWA